MLLLLLLLGALTKQVAGWFSSAAIDCMLVEEIGCGVGPGRRHTAAALPVKGAVAKAST